MLLSLLAFRGQFVVPLVLVLCGSGVAVRSGGVCRSYAGDIKGSVRGRCLAGRKWWSSKHTHPDLHRFSAKNDLKGNM